MSSELEDKPSDIKELDFFTKQFVPLKNGEGFALMWVYKPTCPECGEARLKKPSKRAKKYECSACNAEFKKEEYDELLEYNLEYTCPECGYEGKEHGSWDKPKSKTSTVMLRVGCPECGEKFKVYRMGKKKK